MKLIVVTLAGREIAVEAEPASTITEVKKQIAEKEGIPPEQQRLVFSGKHLDDSETLAQENLTEGSRVHLILSLKGGK